MPAAQWRVGATVSVWRSVDQWSSTAVAGSTDSTAATLVASIGSLKRIGIPARRSVPVATARKAASGKAVIGADGGEAVAGTGRARPTAATATMIPTDARRAALAAFERRARSGR